MARTTARNTHISACHPAATACIILSGRSNTANMSFTAPGVQVTAFGEEYHSRIGDGIKDWEMSIGGFWDGAASNLDEFLYNANGACINIVYGPGGSASGSVKYSGCAILNDYEITGELEGAVEWSANLSAASVLNRGSFS
jgi:hypothetical protein